MSTDLIPVQPADTAQLQIKLKRARTELDWLYTLDRKMDAATHGQAKLTRLLGELTRHLNMSYTVLLVPSKNIRISVTHSNWKAVDRRRLDDKMMRRLFPRYSDSTRPVLLQLPELPPGANGTTGSYQLAMNILRDSNGEAIGVLASFCQVNGVALSTSVDRQLTYVTRLAMRVIGDSYDRLTGMMRHADFVSVLEASATDLQAGQDAHCLVYFDIDKFQVINDTFDRLAGDQVLLRFSKLLQSQAPSGASLGRVGGDQFAVLLRFRDVDAGVAFAEQVRTECQKLVYLRGKKSMPVTISAGVVGLNDYHGHDENPLAAARMACEKAKDHGRDRIETYDAADKSIVRRVDNLQLFTQLQSAISNGEFILDAQPIVALDGTRDRSHFEVLLRMQGPSGDVMLPDQFFAAAEQYQLMPKLDRFVLQTFFDMARGYSDTDALSHGQFSLNLSGQSLGDPAFHQFVRDLVVGSDLAAEQICFEITETAAIANREVAISFMQAMRDLGCLFALDDFGAGLSSFAYLRDMPVDILKIDGSFVKELASNKVSESMVAAVAQVAKVMGLKTVAEYVETDAVCEGLKRMGVDYGQGFLLGRPRPLAAQLQEMAGLSTGTVVNLSDVLEARANLINN